MGAPVFDGTAVLLSVRRHWIAVPAVAILTAAGAVGVSYLLEPRYTATTVIQPVSMDANGDTSQALRSGLGGLAALAGVSLGGQASSMRANLAELSSDTFTRDFIVAHNLMPKLFRDEWDSVSGRWKSVDPTKMPSDWDGITKFNEEVRSVEEDKLTGLVRLRIEWRDPNEAASWANMLVADLNNRARRLAISEADRSIGFLREQLGKTNVVEMQQLIYRLIQEQTQRAMLANVREEYALKVVDIALAPDYKHRTYPRRSMFGGIGLLMGFLLGIGFAIWRDRPH